MDKIHVDMTEKEKLDIKEQFGGIVKGGMAPVLKSAGFKKKGNNFHARVGEMDWCVNIQKNKWGYDDSSRTWQFTINIGVTLP